MTHTKRKDFHLKLFITGASPNSQKAVENINKICETYLKGRYELEIIDVYQHNSEIAEKEQLVALPLLIKKTPLPERKMIGDLSDTKTILKALGIQ